MTDVCPASVQVLAAVVAVMHRESVLPLRQRVLTEALPLEFVLEFCPQARFLQEVANQMHAQGVAPPPLPPPGQQQYEATPA